MARLLWQSFIWLSQNTFWWRGIYSSLQKCLFKPLTVLVYDDMVGRRGIYGSLPNLATSPYNDRALSKSLVGVGVTPEVFILWQNCHEYKMHGLGYSILHVSGLADLCGFCGTDRYILNNQYVAYVFNLCTGRRSIWILQCLTLPWKLAGALQHRTPPRWLKYAFEGPSTCCYLFNKI